MSMNSIACVRSQSQALGSARLLLLIIASHVSPLTYTAWPSVPTLSRECRLSERQVYRLLRQLEHSGELVIIRRSGRVNQYRVHVMPEEYSSSVVPPMSPLNIPTPDHPASILLSCMPDESRVKEDVALSRLNTWLTPGSRIYQLMTSG